MIYDILKAFIADPKIKQLETRIKYLEYYLAEERRRVDRAFEYGARCQRETRNLWKEDQGRRDKLWLVYQRLREKLQFRNRQIQMLQTQLSRKTSRIDLYWNRVALCLMKFHDFDPARALKQTSRARAIFSAAPVDERGIEHIDAFHMACDLAGNKLGLEPRFAEYTKLLEDSR